MKNYTVEIVTLRSGYRTWLVHEGNAPAKPSMGAERVAVLSVKAPQKGEALAYCLVKYAGMAGYLDDEAAA